MRQTSTYQDHWGPLKTQFESELKLVAKSHIKRGEWPNVQKLLQQSWSNCQLNNFEIPEEIKLIVHQYYQELTYPAWLSAYLSGTNLREILIHTTGHGHSEAGNSLEPVYFEVDSEDIEFFFECLAVQAGQSWNYTRPFASFRHSFAGHIFRVTLLHPSTSPEKIGLISLRKISNKTFNLSSFCLSVDLIDFLVSSVRQKKSILIAGSTGSGKTSLLSALLSYVSNNEHVIILEDTEEIVAPSPNWTKMIAADGLGFSLLAYQSYSLRLRPDRICVGELRGAEAIPFMLALNNGHKGLMSTIHANSSEQSIERLGMLFALYKQGEDLSREVLVEMAAKNIDLIIFVENREIKNVIRPLGSENGRLYYETIFENSAL